jgi:flagellar motor switch protein FliN/FliY
MSNAPPSQKSEPPQADTNRSFPQSPEAFSLVRDVEVEITLEIGRRRMRIGDVLRLSPGQTLELNKAAGESIDLLVNGRLVGRGEAIVVGDRYGVRILELVSPKGGRS